MFGMSKDVLYIAFNFFSAIAVIFINKAVFTRVSFKFPGALTFLHYAVTWSILHILRMFKLFDVAQGSMTNRLWCLSLALGVAPCLNNLSLQLNSMGVYQTFKLMVTPAIAVLEYFMMRKVVSARRALLLAVVSAGVCSSMATDFQTTLIGVLVAGMWLPVAAMYKVGWSAAQKQDGWETMSLMYKLLPWGMMWMLVVVPLMDPPGITNFNFNLYSCFWLLLSGLAAFLVNWSGFLLLGHCAPLTHVILGQAKSCVIMLGGWLLFDYDPGYKSLMGAAVAIVAIVVYTKVNLAEVAAAKAAALKGQELKAVAVVDEELQSSHMLKSASRGGTPKARETASKGSSSEGVEPGPGTGIGAGIGPGSGRGSGDIEQLGNDSETARLLSPRLTA